MNHITTVEAIQNALYPREQWHIRRWGKGYRATCDCGWKGQVHSTHNGARADGDFHEGGADDASITIVFLDEAGRAGRAIEL